MSTFKFAGNPNRGGLPRGSNVRVEALNSAGGRIPRRDLVWEGKVSDAAYLDLDPGKYVYSVVRKSSPPRVDDTIYTGEFLHEVTEESYKALQSFSPRLFKVINTSDGVRWDCLHPMCEEKYTSAMAALLHEMEHFGIGREAFLADPRGTAARAAAGKAEEFSQSMKAAAKAAGRQAPSPIPA